MPRLLALTAPMAVLSGCATAPVVPVTPPAVVAPSPVEVQILAFNDFHGNLETPADPITIKTAVGGERRERFGGAAQLGATLDRLRQPNTVTVSAGDTIGATPLISGYYLDEPTIEAMNRVGLEFNAVGNHEFDKGVAELKRIQSGGCAVHTSRQPCAVEPFAGARFRYLAANVIQQDGSTVFPATGMKSFGTGATAVQVGFIGMTLKDTANLVTPSGVRGVTFREEAATANALVPVLKAQGADAIVLLIHQGGRVSGSYVEQGCEGISGDILPVLDQLDPAITTIVSGHTHNAYACELDRGGARRLLTSAGKNGFLVSDIRLTFAPGTQQLIAQSARNVPVAGQPVAGGPVKQLVDQYAAAIKPVADKVIGRLTAAAPRDPNDGESPAANLIADAMLGATRGAREGGAQLALVNATGVRVGLPAGDVRYGEAFAMMPFGNNLVVMTLTGAQLKAAMEQQYDAPDLKRDEVEALAPSEGFTYEVDLSRPAGDRVTRMTLNGKAIQPGSRYRVVVNNYVAAGGDGLTGFTAGTDVTDAGIIDLDGLVAWVAPGRAPPKPDRIRVTG